MKLLVKKIKKAINQGTLLDKVFLQLIISSGFSNKELFPVQERYKQYLRLKKQYCRKQTKKYTLNKSSNPKIIWICWLQGIENAPDIVKACYNSILNNCADWKTVVLTESNIFEYVDMPSFVVDKWKKGIISNTHFSDLLRMEILIKYGGLWSDATVFYTGDIPKYVYEADFFTFNHSLRYDLAVVFESWFIYSVPNHPLLLQTRDMIYNYWKINNKLNEYFLFHLFFTISTEIYPEYWERVPFYSDIIPHILAREIFNTFDKKRFDQIKEMTNIHKLTYKLDEEKMKRIDTNYYEIVSEVVYADKNK